MSQYVFKLPDLGEGTVEAEIGEWRFKVGDTVSEDDVIVDMMTDKAAVEIPSPVSGRIASLHGEQGDIVAVGTNLIVFDLDGDAGEPADTAPAATPEKATESAVAVAPTPIAATTDRAKVLTSPAIRAKAKKAGIDLATVPGSGPRGRILPRDYEAFVASGGQTPHASMPHSRATAETEATEEIKVIGVRRVIARKMSEAKRTIPHFTYVDEIDVTEFEALR
ncbi:MAG: biotin/lipoyl-containing protein, partial [Pseudomonadota bacterium]